MCQVIFHRRQQYTLEKICLGSHVHCSRSHVHEKTSLPFTNEVLNIVSRHDVYSFLDGYFGYHCILIAPRDRHKTTFVTDWGTFTCVVKPIGVNNGPPTY